MKCPVCDNNNLKVTDTASDDTRVIRRRKCTHCGQIFYSEETLRMRNMELSADLVAIKNQVNADAVIKSRKFVLVNGGHTKAAALVMMHEIIGQVDEVLADKLEIRRDAIVTDNLIVRFVSSGDRLHNLRCDECFGFDLFNTINLRKGVMATKFGGTLTEYIIMNA